MMTYGWAILIIVIVAVILYSMGIFNPSSSLVATVTGFAGFSVQANCVAGGTIVMSLGNIFGYPVYLQNATIYLPNATSLSEPIDYPLTASGSHVFFLQHACPTKVGSHYTDKIILTGTEYNSLNSPITVTGSISGSISAIVPYHILENITVQGFPTANTITNNGYYVWQPNQGPGTVSIVNVVSASVVKTLTGLPARAIVFSKNDSLAFIAGNSGASGPGYWMVVMNTSNYKILKNISKVCSPQMLSLSSNGKYVFIPGLALGGSPCDRFIVLNVSNLNVVANVSEDGLSVWSAAESPNGQYIYLTDPWANDVSIMNSQTYTITKNITGFASPNSIAFTPNNQYVYIGGGKYITKIDLATQSVVGNYSVLNKLGISGLTISNDGNYIYAVTCSSSGDGITPVFDTSTNSVVANITLNSPADHCMSYGVLSPSNNFLYEASATGNSLFVISV